MTTTGQRVRPKKSDQKAAQHIDQHGPPGQAATNWERPPREGVSRDAAQRTSQSYPQINHGHDPLKMAQGIRLRLFQGRQATRSMCHRLGQKAMPGDPGSDAQTTGRREPQPEA